MSGVILAASIGLFCLGILTGIFVASIFYRGHIEELANDLFNRYVTWFHSEERKARHR